MARNTRKALTAAEAQRQTLRLWLDKLPPDVAAAAVLAGTASLAGFTPPFTRLLQMTFMSSTDSANANKGPAEDFHNFFEVLSPGYALISWLVGEPDSAPTPSYPTDPGSADKVLKTIGLFCASALEGAMMYNAMKNPEVLTTMIRAPAEILKGIGAVVPG